MKHSIKVICEDHHITRRALEAVQALINRGIEHDDIARLTGCTVTTLLNPSTRLNRSHYQALAAHFNVCRLWLWTGLGPMFLDESKLKSKIV